MTRNDKTPAATGVCHCIEPCLICDRNPTTNPPKKQQLPKLGSAVRVYLRRYAANMVDYFDADNKTTSSMIDCCNYLLIEADRLEGGGL